MQQTEATISVLTGDSSRLKVQRQVLAGFGLAIAVLGLVSIVAARSTARVGETASWISHTQSVLAALKGVEAAVNQATAAQRGHLITSHERYLVERDNALAQLQMNTQALKELTIDNAVQQANLVVLEQAIQRRRSMLDDLTTRYATEGFDAARTLMLTGEPAATDTSFRGVLARMDAAERHLLEERTEADRKAAQFMRASFTVLTVVVAALLTILGASVRRATRASAELDKALRRSNSFLESIFENIPNMVFIKDAEDLRFVRMNRAGEALLGIPREELLGKSDLDLFPAAEAEAFIAKDRETLSQDSTVLVPEERIETRNRGQRWLSTKKLAIRQDGRPEFLLGISEDITDHKRAEQALEQSLQAQRALNRELESFSYSVAHDLRAPLRSIDGFSRALREDYADALDADGKRYLGNVCESVARMAELIDDLLDLSRVSRSELAMGPVDLTALAGAAIARLRKAHPDRTVEVNIDEGLTDTGDPRLLAVVFDNLLGNAWKFTGKSAGARISLALASDGPVRTYVISDNGAGFDMAYTAKLFGVFQRLHSAAEFEGTGIGLATVQRVIDRHGGRVWAEAQVNAGARFYFTLNEKRSTT